MTGRNVFQNTWFYRLVGARGAAGIPLPSPIQTDVTKDVVSASSLPQNNFLSAKVSNFGSIYQGEMAAREIAQHRVVFFGEIHSRASIVSFQRMIQEEMAKVPPREGKVNAGTPGVLHVVFEHFSFDMQELLDAYQEGRMSFDELVQKYNEIGTEGHDLEPYQKLLEDAKHMHNNSSATHRKVQLHAGFLSRKYARMLMKEGEEATFKEAAPWLPRIHQDLLKGTDFHYNIFESLLTGRSIGSTTQPDNRFRKIFQAQLLKDVALAHKVNTLLDAPTVSAADSDRQGGTLQDMSDKILVLAGNGHVLGYSGVPERVLQQHPELSPDTCVLVSHHSTLDMDNKGKDTQDGLSMAHSILQELKGAGTNLADYVYVYREPQEAAPHGQEPIRYDSPTAVKEETKQAYDRVGESAHIKGNAAKAVAIMTAMGYSSEQIDIAGKDVHNFQGVGNPHIHANIQPGDTVLDVGSGLGIDSFIAYDAASASPASRQHQQHGFVLGIDLSGKEVRHAQSCAQGRKLPDVRFAQADMDQIPLPDNCVDVVISNGAFCLAPDKEKAFAEVFRVLKPGGRISICTTTTQDESKLEPGVSWPICMKMFYPKNDLVPLCERIGYVDVFVDDSDSSMSMELPEEVMRNETENPNAPAQRNKVHVGSPEFSHLENYDMDALCARVCVVARKPMDR